MPYTKSELFILTGPVHTGKSSTLEQLCGALNQNDKIVRGLLNPSIEGEKWFLDAYTQDRFKMEEKLQKDSIQVGRFTFSASAFTRAQSIINRAQKKSCDLFVIDEIGKLELRAEGLEPAISNFIENLVQAEIKKVILVIRDFLVSDAIEHFRLKDARVITSADLNIERWV